MEEKEPQSENQTEEQKDVIIVEKVTNEDVSSITNNTTYQKNRTSYGAVNENRQSYVLDTDLMDDNYISTPVPSQKDDNLLAIPEKKKKKT